MSNIATMISQSRKLIELGLDPSTADMYYPYLGSGMYGDTPRIGFPIEYSGGKDIHAWSLSALLNVMPKGTELVKMQNDAYAPYYEIDYMYTGYEDKDVVTTAYEMACWLLEQGLIKKGGKQ